MKPIIFRFNSLILIFLLIILIPRDLLSEETKWLVIKDYFPKGEIEKDYKAFTDIELSEKEVYIVENIPGYQVHIYEKGGGLIHTGGGKGKKPGELVAPVEFSIWNNEIIVKDNSGLSVFSNNCGFLRLIRPFVAIVSFVYVKDKIYILVGTPGQNSLIQVFTSEGKFIKELGEEFVTLDYSLYKNMSPIRAKGIIYEGKLLSDNKFLYYLNSKFGKVMKFSLSGEKISEVNISEALGKVGEEIIEKNTKLWLEDGIDMKETKGRIPSNELFADAYLCGASIYILTRGMVQIQDGWKSENKVVVLNKNSFQKENEYAIRKADDEYILALAVEEKNKELIFYFTMARKNDGTIISEYRRGK